MTKATKTTAKTDEQKAAEQAERDRKAQEKKDKAAAAKEGGTSSSAPIVTLPSGTGTQDDEPPASNPPPLERGAGEREPKERKEDTLRLPEDKARWNYGVSTNDTAELLREQREIDASTKR